MDWDSYFMEMVYVVAKRSKDPNTKVGCVIVGPDNEIRSTGYNSFPRGIDDNVQERLERPEKYIWIEHADRNAIYNAARVGTSVKGCRMYLPWYPCTNCARGIINSGICEVVIDNRDSNPWKGNDSRGRWQEDIDRSKQMLLEAGVVLREWDDR